jgi:protein tyrosine/serine phosphatase
MEVQEPRTVAEPAPRVRAAWRRFGLGVIALVSLSAVGAESYRVVAGSNFHVVIPGQICRSAQPTPAFIDMMVREQGIRTILNLRGAGEGPMSEWYDDEAAACVRHGLSLENLTFSAGRLPSTVEVQRLLEVLDRADKPILIHCRRGADRTGVASAIALLTLTDTPYSTARRSLGMRYGHSDIGTAGLLQGFFDQYQRWLQANGLAHDSPTFRRWLTEHYSAGRAKYEVVACRRLQPEPHAKDVIGYRVTFRNTSPEPWDFHASGRGGVRFGYVVAGRSVPAYFDGRGGYLDRVVAPGETIELTAPFPPLAAGTYRVRFDLIDEDGRAWFQQLGNEPWEEEFIVRE